MVTQVLTSKEKATIFALNSALEMTIVDVISDIQILSLDLSARFMSIEKPMLLNGSSDLDALLSVFEYADEIEKLCSELLMKHKELEKNQQFQLVRYVSSMYVCKNDLKVKLALPYAKNLN